jgi:hypothetical protein
MNQEMNTLVNSLTMLECWYVSCGATGSTFQLAFGRKVPRTERLRNPDHSVAYQKFEGEANLLVWCAWRLDTLDRPVTSWDDTTQGFEQGLARLIGARVESFELRPPAWDLDVRFTNGLTLRVFCDHVPGEPSFDGNWELWKEDKALFVGPGANVTVEERTTAKR